jgi:CCR4-NOT transcriptional regulation complex NOT5 subunit
MRAVDNCLAHREQVTTKVNELTKLVTMLIELADQRPLPTSSSGSSVATPSSAASTSTSSASSALAIDVTSPQTKAPTRTLSTPATTPSTDSTVSSTSSSSVASTTVAPPTPMGSHGGNRVVSGPLLSGLLSPTHANSGAMTMKEARAEWNEAQTLAYQLHVARADRNRIWDRLESLF